MIKMMMMMMMMMMMNDRVLTGDGVSDMLMMLVQLTQNLLKKKISVIDHAIRCTVMDVRTSPGIVVVVVVVVVQDVKLYACVVWAESCTHFFVFRVRLCC